MEIRKRGLLYLRKSKSIPAENINVELLSWISPKYDEIISGKEYQTRAQITHIGNAIATNLFYTILYGDTWVFDYQIAPPNRPFEFPVPLDVESEDIIVMVSNKNTSDAVAEICIVGTYERDRFKKLEEQRPLVEFRGIQRNRVGKQLMPEPVTY